nr:hypothetical protein [Acidiferrobacter sp. SPIII_3]
MTITPYSLCRSARITMPAYLMTTGAGGQKMSERMPVGVVVDSGSPDGQVLDG